MDNKKRVLKGSAHASPETRRAELLQAAIACFGRKGYFSTTIDHIAKEAGLSKGSVYRFFKSKDEVLFALMHNYKQEVDELLQPKLEEAENSREAVRILIRTIIVYLSQHTEMERTWREFAYHPIAVEEYAKMLLDFREELDGILQSGIKEGVFIEQETTPVPDILIAFHEGILELSTNLGEFDALERFDNCWGVLERSFVKPELCI